MTNNLALIAALSELDYEESPQDIQRVIDVLDATRKAWINMSQADYDKLIWQDERIALQRVEFEMNGVDE